ncbi:hypothetical protein OSB04_003982 [Centaurea solstitialis]|uniref:Uncharacterized protein n=1 Tax=Centaurea solstitialis TaxID=347529 RepID=A0AA38U6D9_9ASTR|nr:hypothetical protein OSB04_003982 [Centaurea solstitialis]
MPSPLPHQTAPSPAYRGGVTAGMPAAPLCKPSQCGWPNRTTMRHRSRTSCHKKLAMSPKLVKYGRSGSVEFDNKITPIYLQVLGSF